MEDDEIMNTDCASLSLWNGSMLVWWWMPGSGSTTGGWMWWMVAWMISGAICFVAGVVVSVLAISYFVLLPQQHGGLAVPDWNEPEEEEEPTTTQPKTSNAAFKDDKEPSSKKEESVASNPSPTPPNNTKSPTKQIPWPWDRMHNHKRNKPTRTSTKTPSESGHSQQQQDGEEEDDRMEYPYSESSRWLGVPPLGDAPRETKSSPLAESTSIPPSPTTIRTTKKQPGVCIGSIFGWDVGGTLAKLVYFEERPNFAKSASSAALLYGTASSPGGGPLHAHPPSPFVQATLDDRRPLRSFLSSLDTTTTTRPHTSVTDQSHHKPTRRRRSLSNGNLAATSSPPLVPPPSSPTQDENNPTMTKESSSSNLMLEFLTQREHRAQALDRFYAFARDNLNANQSSTSTSTSTTATSAPNMPTADRDSSGTTSTKDHATTSLDPHDEGGGGEEAKATTTTVPPSSPSTIITMNHNNNNYDIVCDEQLSFDCLDGTFHFLHFETRRMHDAVELIRWYDLHHAVSTLGATGGGAHKYAQVFEQELGITMKRFDELQCLVVGMQFVLRTVVGECYTYRPPQDQEDKEHGHVTEHGKKKRRKRKKRVEEEEEESPRNEHYGNYVGVVEQDSWALSDNEEEALSRSTAEQDQGPMDDEDDDDDDDDGDDGSSAAAASFKGPAAPRPGKLDEWWWSRKVPRDAISEASTYPYLLVTIGTGVSIVRVDGPGRHERISGSTIGGGTYWGLIRLLTSVDNFADVIRLAERGDPSKVDMMVGDIYGPNQTESLEKLGLRADLVASSFGKLVAKENPAEGLREQDLARALLLMVTINIGQVAYLNAQLHATSRIYFVGNFLRQNKLSQRRLSFAIDYWSKGQMEALFLEHEGYFGALGAFLLSQDQSSPFAYHPGNSSKATSPNANHGQPGTTTSSRPRSGPKGERTGFLDRRSFSDLSIFGTRQQEHAERATSGESQASSLDHPMAPGSSASSTSSAAASSSLMPTPPSVTATAVHAAGEVVRGLQRSFSSDRPCW